MVVAALAIGAWSGVAAFEHGRPHVEAWQEIAWPFPRDGWPAGRAFHCSGELCGDEVELYVRPKIGFCNCDSGVADDDEVDRVADLDLMSQRFRPLEPGKAVRIADMPAACEAMISGCPTARNMPPSASRCRGAATFWSRSRRARARRRAFRARRWIFLAQATWRAG